MAGLAVDYSRGWLTTPKTSDVVAAAQKPKQTQQAGQRYNGAGQAVYPGGINPNPGGFQSPSPNIATAQPNPTPSLSSRAGFVSPGASDQQQQTQLEYDLRRQEMASRNAMLQGLFTSQGGAGATVQYGQGGPDETAARNAAFARAKEQAGSTARSALMSLQNTVDDRGMTGSSVEAGLTGGAIGGAANQVGDFTREQLMQDLARSKQVADTVYQGRITQRGQDMNKNQALLGLMAGAAY